MIQRMLMRFDAPFGLSIVDLCELFPSRYNEKPGPHGTVTRSVTGVAGPRPDETPAHTGPHRLHHFDSRSQPLRFPGPVQVGNTEIDA